LSDKDKRILHPMTERKRRAHDEMLTSRPDISIFFPVYNDENTVRLVTEKALAALGELADRGEVIIVDDGSPDRSGEIADRLAEENPAVRVIHHQKNHGYGEAIKTGLRAAQYEWICFTDGDDQYDISDLRRLICLIDYYELVITFRYAKIYSAWRIFVSWVYNRVVRFLFRTPYRDISTGLRLIRRSLAKQLDLQSSSPFIGAEIAIKVMFKGFPVGEVGIQTFPRRFGEGGTVTPANIWATIKDMLWIYRKIFSVNYEVPESRLAGERRERRS
jgi:glycosyltransferase involved in cell wall biosynthesis